MNQRVASRTKEQRSIRVAVVTGLLLAFCDFIANALIAGATGAVRVMGSPIRILRSLSAGASPKGSENGELTKVCARSQQT